MRDIYYSVASAPRLIQLELILHGGTYICNNRYIIDIAGYRAGALLPLAAAARCPRAGRGGRCCRKYMPSHGDARQRARHAALRRPDQYMVQGTGIYVGYVYIARYSVQVDQLLG